MTETKGKKTVVIVFSALLVLLGVTCEILGNIQWMGRFTPTPEMVTYVLLSVAALYYVSVGYKKPHGNLLRYTFLLLSVACINGLIDTAVDLTLTPDFHVNAQLVILGLDGLSAVLIAYVAGRLDKVKKNCPALLLITAMQIAIAVLFVSIYENWGNFVFLIWDFSTCFLWIDLMVAYLIRYREHKEAGLTDK